MKVVTVLEIRPGMYAFLITTDEGRFFGLMFEAMGKHFLTGIKEFQSEQEFRNDVMTLGSSSN